MNPASEPGPSDPTGVAGSSSSALSAATESTPPSRYQSQKRCDWNTFLKYLKNHKPPLTPARCGGAHVVEFLMYLDQFGKTKVHVTGCRYFGHPDPAAPCPCPLRQAWGSLDAIIGRLRAAYEENGGKAESNPFAARGVMIYLKEVRECQTMARGIPYAKKRKRQAAAAAEIVSAVAATEIASAVAAGAACGGGDGIGIGGGGGIAATSGAADAMTTNKTSRIKVALEFVSPENVSECIRLTNEFRLVCDNHRAKEDKLEVKKMILRAVCQTVEEYCELIEKKKKTRRESDGGAVERSTSGCLEPSRTEPPTVKEGRAEPNVVECVSRDGPSDELPRSEPDVPESRHGLSGELPRSKLDVPKSRPESSDESPQLELDVPESGSEPLDESTGLEPDVPEVHDVEIEQSGGAIQDVEEQLEPPQVVSEAIQVKEEPPEGIQTIEELIYICRGEDGVVTLKDQSGLEVKLHPDWLFAESCRNVGLDFISPANVGECIRLTGEFSSISENHRAKEDKLEANKMVHHAIDKPASESESTISSDEVGGAFELSTLEPSQTEANVIDGESRDEPLVNMSTRSEPGLVEGKLSDGGIDEGINMCSRDEDGVVTLKDQSSGLVVKLNPDSLFAEVKEDYRAKLISIFELRPDTFMHLGNMSTLFTKMILETFGQLLEMFEQTNVSKACQADFNELLRLLAHLRRGLLRVEWLEDRVRKMAARARYHSLTSELKAVDQKMDELVEKRWKLRQEAREFEQNSLGDIDINGNVAQGLF